MKVPSLVQFCCLILILCWNSLVLGIEVPPCGTELDRYRDVPAFFNGIYQGTGDSCGDDGSYGSHYQCVEYIKRFYAQALGVDTSHWHGNAIDYYKNGPEFGLLRFENGASHSLPLPGDIIVFAGSRANSLGHVAIVTEVSGSVVTCIEQNWSKTGTAKLNLSIENGFYVINPRGSYQILGWLRLPQNQVILQPGPESGKDIWTTSVFSYAPGGSFPGGGLDNQELIIGGWGDLYCSLLQFDLDGMPQRANSVYLELYPYIQTGFGSTGIYLDLITQPWDWKTQGFGRDRLRLWWADRPTVQQFFLQPLAAPTVGQWYRIDITELYNAWKSGELSNYGIQLRPASNNNQWAHFLSSDYLDDPSLRPKLVIEPGKPLIFPQ